MKPYKDLSDRLEKVLNKLNSSESSWDAVKHAREEILKLLAEYDSMVQTTRDAIVREFIAEMTDSPKVTSLMEKLENIRAFHTVDEDDRKG